MTGYVISAQGDATALPAPLSWTFQYTSGVPCDSFQVRCLWEGTNTVDPRQWCTFQALDEDQVVFTGVVDECETALTPQGAWIDVSGRGMAARLLDNEALGQDYQVATLADILRYHVSPYGITVASQAYMAPVSQFSVASGPFCTTLCATTTASPPALIGRDDWCLPPGRTIPGCCWTTPPR